MRLQTSGRLYWTRECTPGIWTAHYQPLNPRTGKPWQASREITAGWDCWRGFKYRSGAPTMVGEIVHGQVPAFEAWSATWTSLRAGYTSEELAERAIKQEIARSGK